MNIRNHRRQKGFTLIELMIGIAIASIMLFGIFFMVNKVQAKRVASQASTTLNGMVADARAKFTAQGNFTGVNSQVLIDNNIPPKSMIDATGKIITSEWNTPITVAPVTLFNADDSISFTYKVPASDCSDFVTNAEASFGKVTVGATPVKDISIGGALNTMSAATLGSACKSQGGGSIDLVFVQGR